MSYFADKNVLVTGVSGTIGSALLERLSREGPKEILGIDNAEHALFLQQQQYAHDPRVELFICDIKDREELTRLMSGIDIVFHIAALKHVELNERSPNQTVSTNIDGVQNVIEAALANDVEKVLFTSSDKAVNPTSVMGTTKLMGERLITAANNQKRRTPVFSSTRFGNVLGSSGSVYQVFLNQISRGGPVTLTDESMTRFVMSVNDAVELILNSAELARGGEVFITKMPVISIASLARAMINEMAANFGHEADSIAVDIIGSKPGEKMFEELMNEEEVRRAIELDDFFVVLPALNTATSGKDYEYPSQSSQPVSRPYNSSLEPAMSDEDLLTLLRKLGLGSKG